MLWITGNPQHLVPVSDKMLGLHFRIVVIKKKLRKKKPTTGFLFYLHSDSCYSPFLFLTYVNFHKTAYKSLQIKYFLTLATPLKYYF